MTDFATYRLDVYDTSGTLQAKITDFTTLAYTRRVNSPGVVQFGLAGNHSLLATLADKWQVEVWRKPDGGDWGREITGLYRMGAWRQTSDGLSTFVALCNGLMSILDWRIVAWTANYTNRSKFTSAAAETVMNTLVKYNATSDATTANGRLRAGAITGLTVEADGADGNTVDWFCAFDNLLETLQKLAGVAGGDFDVVKTSSTAWQWRYYDGQLGTDRSASVIFSIGRGNMASPVFIDNRTQEQTVAIVGGQGEGAARATAIRTGTNYDASTNNIEMFVNAADVDTTAGLNTRGDERLDRVEAVRDFQFKVLQTPANAYGVHYFLGDLVTAINPFDATSYTQKVQSVSVSLDDNGGESIDVELVTP